MTCALRLVFDSQMRLPDFNFHPGLNELRRKMGAALIEVSQEDPEWTRLSIKLEQEGIDVSFDEVEVQDDFTFEYRGQKVVVYIRDQNSAVMDRGGEYKFHVAQCRTLDSMQQKNRHGRYVVTNRKDGMFVVNIIRTGASPIATEMEMRICKNCLSTLGLPGDPNKFSLIGFFAKNSSQIKKVPRHNEMTAPINAYTHDWRNVARKLKEAANWRCEGCSESFSSRRELLHVHHVDGDKSNNRAFNLRVLCQECHAAQPGHEHMREGSIVISVLTSGPGDRRVAEEVSSGYSKDDAST